VAATDSGWGAHLPFPTTPQASVDLASITEYLRSQAFSSASEQMDFVREWVFGNSVHSVDEEHAEYAFDTAKVLSMLWKTHRTGAGHAHLSCGPRAHAMKAILDESAIPSRRVVVFSGDYPEVTSHTFLEVLNAETGTWELQDPDYNVCYEDRSTGARLPTARLVFVDLDPVTPTSMRASGWEDTGVEHLKEHFFEALLYADHLGEDTKLLFVNTTRFDTDKVFEGNEGVTFYEFAATHYWNPLIVELEGPTG
jgi:hypothetical protein